RNRILLASRGLRASGPGATALPIGFSAVGIEPDRFGVRGNGVIETALRMKLIAALDLSLRTCTRRIWCDLRLGLLLRLRLGLLRLRRHRDLVALEWQQAAGSEKYTTDDQHHRANRGNTDPGIGTARRISAE